MQFGDHQPQEQHSRGITPLLAAFSRGIAMGGTQWKFQFPNGYGASVIDDGYGQDQGLYEVAVLYGGRLTYDTPITDDVLGYQTEEQVAAALDAIEALNPATEAAAR